MLFKFENFVYQTILKPIFFLLDAEFVHDLTTTIGLFLGKYKATRYFTKLLLNPSLPTTKKQIDGIYFPGFIGLPAGFDYNANLTQILPAVGFGFVTVGTVTLEPYAGNPKPRLGRLPKSGALLVNKGLKTIGARAVVDKLQKLKFVIPVGISIGATNRAYKNEQEQINNYLQCFELFEKSSVSHSYYELNISCPNTFGGEPFTTPLRLAKLLSKLKILNIRRPVYLKMPIDLSENEIMDLLKTASKHIYIKGVIFGNLTKDHNNPDINPEDRKTWSKTCGNLSGRPTFNRSNQLISFTKKNFKNRFTIIGCGGIFSAADAKVKLSLGADLLQLITGMIYQGPQLIGQINRSLN